jgi:beta-fructofuranosidase
VCSSRREFLKTAGASASLAAFPRFNSSLFRFHPEEALQAKLAADPLRPQFHLLPAKNWMNDPNGPIFWNGLYHMFYQYNPNAAVWGDMHWNHAVSEDMIHWRHMPVALAPTPGWDDADGCFTGSAVNDNGVATILYTGVKTSPPDRATLRDGNHNFREVQCLATSSDPQLRFWNKWKEPVIQPPNDPKLAGFRDPFLWQDEETKTWYLGVASGQYKVGGCVLLYRSKDLRNWEYLHPLASGQWTGRENVNPVDSGEMWECPDFFPLGKKHVLLYSTAGQVIWEVGELDPKELVFHPQTRGVLDHGAYYAQKTQLDAKGNRILWGWIPEKRPDSELIAAGWAGCMALPRLLSVADDGSLKMEFAGQVDALAHNPFRLVLAKDKVVRGWYASELAKFRIGNLSGQLQFRASRLPFSLELQDQTGSWLSIALGTPAEDKVDLSVNQIRAAIPSVENSPYDFRIFVDGSVAELICNQRHAFTIRVYRQPNGPLAPKFNGEYEFPCLSLDGSQMRPISKDRLTT